MPPTALTSRAVEFLVTGSDRQFLISSQVWVCFLLQDPDKKDSCIQMQKEESHLPRSSGAYSPFFVVTVTQSLSRV